VSTLNELLGPEVEHIRNALPEGLSFDDWYSDGMPFDVFVFADDLHREAVSYARGYLHGAADALDVTLLELLWDEGFAAVIAVPATPTTLPKARKRARKG